MRIYIRHGEKAYRNGRPTPFSRDGRRLYAHDPPLTRRGKNDAIKLASELLELYPPPSRIITSPYLRARQTTAEMISVLVNREAPVIVTIQCQNEISEYLGNHANSSLDVLPGTHKHSPPHPETFNEFQERIRLHYRKFKESEEEEVVWVVTHGIVINEILKPHYGSQSIPYLGYIICERRKRPLIRFP